MKIRKNGETNLHKLGLITDLGVRDGSFSLRGLGISSMQINSGRRPSANEVKIGKRLNPSDVN